MRQRVAFLHLPKSAGSSVRTAVTEAAGPERVAPFQLDRTLFGEFDEFDRVDPAVRAVVLDAEGNEPGQGDGNDGPGLGGYDVALGHFALSTLRRHFDDADVFSLLREPRARLVSHFSFWFGWSAEQHAAWAPYRASRVPADRGWEGFLTAPSIASQTDNLMVRLLLAPHPDVPAGDFIAPDRIDALAEEAAAALLGLGHVDIIDRDLVDRAAMGGGADFWGPLAAWLGAELHEVRDNVTPRAPDAPDWVASITPSSEAAVAARTCGDRHLWEVVAARTMAPADVAALADAAYLRQVLRAAGQTSRPDPTTDAAAPPELTHEPGQRRAIDRTIDRAKRFITRARAGRGDRRDA